MLAGAGNRLPPVKHRPLHSTRLAVTIALVTSVGSASLANAQDQNVDLPKHAPSPAGDRFFGVPSPYVPGALAFHGGVALDYAHGTLSLVDADDKVLARVVEHQLLLDVNLALALFNRLEISADMPFAVVNRGDGTIIVGNGVFASPDGPGLSDLRLGVRGRLFGEYFDPFQIAIGGYFWAPTATKEEFLGSGFRAEPHLLIGGRADRFVYATKAGVMLAQERQDLGALELGHRFQWGVGLGVLVGAKRQVQLGAETSGAFQLLDPATDTMNGEVLAGVKWRAVSPLEIGVAAGPGFTNGPGTPDVRAVLSVQYTPEVRPPEADDDRDGIENGRDACPKVPGKPNADPGKNGCPPDRDGDGILDEEDACVDVRGVRSRDPRKNGCPPERDRDGDRIRDDDDACPDVAGERSSDPKRNGCPPDRDGDGVVDADDACVDIPGVATPSKQDNGCPPDTDGDGFRDDMDACPREKGVADADPSKRGCPKLVRVTAKEIVILEQVQFDTGRATIKPASNGLLESVAQVLGEHPEILEIEVQGHTDDRGAAGLNAKLSQDRAEAVRAALVSRGIAASRLVARGYGSKQPIESNTTDAGRQKNRRVQFVVLKKESHENKN